MPRRKVEEGLSAVDLPTPETPVGEALPKGAEEVPGVVPVPAAVGPVQAERRAAAWAHGSILLNLITGVGGPVLALIIWLIHDRKSEYAGEQALQAVVFQTIALLLTLLFGTIAVVLWLVTAALIRVAVGLCLVPFALGFSTITAALIVGSLIYGCAGALAALDGRDFRYRWVADWIHPRGRP